MRPRNVAVLLPVYNSEGLVSRAVNSILLQSFENFDFLIYDDSSTDGTFEELRKIRDSRIRIESGDTNIGESKARNLLLRETSARFVFIMDADDEAHPRRLEVQLRYLERFSNVMVLGSWASTFTRNRFLKPPISDKEIRFQLKFKNPIVHPTVALNRSLIGFGDLYPLSRHPTPDLWLWRSLAQNSSHKFANLPLPLVRYKMPTEELMLARQLHESEADLRDQQLMRRVQEPRPRRGTKVIRRIRASELLEFTRTLHTVALSRGSKTRAQEIS